MEPDHFPPQIQCSRSFHSLEIDRKYKYLDLFQVLQKEQEPNHIINLIQVQLASRVQFLTKFYDSFLKQIRKFQHSIQSYFYLTMLSVHPPVQMDRHEMSMGSNQLSEREEVPMSQPIKQQEKKQMITPAKVLIGVAIFCILAMASYKVYTITFPTPSESKIVQSHGKMIQNAESTSGKQTNSQTGSQSSGGRRNNKPLGVAATVGKDVISSNPGSGSDGDDEEPSDSNQQNRRKKLMDNNKMADGTSTEGESGESVDDDADSGQNEGQVVSWPNNGGSNGMPMVGNKRN